MKRIIIHHTGGTYTPNQTDLNAYHYLIDRTGAVHKGVYKPEDNLNCTDGKYAAHTKLGNTGSIGVAACCNYGFDLRKKVTLYPITMKQFEGLCKLCAELCIKYNIKVTDVYTHYGFDYIKKISQGKSDIAFLPWKPELNPLQVQSHFINRIRHYVNLCNK